MVGASVENKENILLIQLNAVENVNLREKIVINKLSEAHASST